MARQRLDEMRRNPAGDWRIDDVIAICREFGIRCTPPTGGGSHYKVSHPSRRPIKPIYIRKQLRFVESIGR